MEIPRSFSISIQSEVAWREALRDLTDPASWIAPPNSRNFSVSVVLPASGCEMIAKVRRRAISSGRRGMGRFSGEVCPHSLTMGDARQDIGRICDSVPSP